MKRLLLCALLVAGPALAGPKEDIAAADKAFSALSVAQGSNAAFLAYLADDGRLFGTGNQPPIYGKAAAVEAFKTSSNGDPKTNVLSWAPDNVEASADGMLGYSDGRWTFVSPAAKLSGHYVTVWRKVGDAWKVAADIGTTDPQPKK